MVSDPGDSGLFSARDACGASRAAAGLAIADGPDGAAPGGGRAGSRLGPA